MSLCKMLLVTLILFALLVVACGQQIAPTPTKGTISVPGVGNPASTTQAAPRPTRKDYPAPAVQTPNATGYPAPASGETLLNDRCVKCHNLDRVKSAKKSVDEWKSTVERMIGKGAQINPAEKNGLINYLAETYKK
jgi:cytochrome c5